MRYLSRRSAAWRGARVFHVIHVLLRTERINEPRKPSSFYPAFSLLIRERASFKGLVGAGVPRWRRGAKIILFSSSSHYGRFSMQPRVFMIRRSLGSDCRSNSGNGSCLPCTAAVEGLGTAQMSRTLENT